MAQALLHTSTRFLKGTPSDTLSDFYHDLLHEAEEEEDEEKTSRKNNTNHFFRNLIAIHQRNCVLPFHVATSQPTYIQADFEQRILEEYRAIHAYVRTWQSSGAYPEHDKTTVQDALETQVSGVIYPWPTIQRSAVPEREDGRLVKSHPLDFPMGQADFRQPRLNSRFSAFDYVQHKFRYFDGRFLSTMRGQRITWALFNIALRESSHYVGSLVHKQSGKEALTKAQLKDLLAEREDLVRRVASFGADIPTTPMHRKRQW